LDKKASSTDGTSRHGGEGKKREVLPMGGEGDTGGGVKKLKKKKVSGLTKRGHVRKGERRVRNHWEKKNVRRRKKKRGGVLAHTTNGASRRGGKGNLRWKKTTTRGKKRKIQGPKKKKKRRITSRGLHRAKGLTNRQAGPRIAEDTNSQQASSKSCWGFKGGENPPNPPQKKSDALPLGELNQQGLGELKKLKREEERKVINEEKQANG